MTVQATHLREEYSGNDTTAVYSYGWRIFKSSDLRLVKLTAEGDEVDLVLGVDYSVQSVGSKNGGTITLLAGNLASGEKLAILSALPYEQQTDFRNQGAFYPETHEDQFDRLTLMAKQNESNNSRSLLKSVFGDYFNATEVPIRNLPEPTEDSDAVRFKYVTDLFGTTQSALQSANEAEQSATTAVGASNISTAARDTTLAYRNEAELFTAQALQYRDSAQSAESLTLNYRNSAQGFRNESEDFKESAKNSASYLENFLDDWASDELDLPQDLGFITSSVLQARYNLGSVTEGTTPPPSDIEDFGLISEA